MSLYHTYLSAKGFGHLFIGVDIPTDSFVPVVAEEVPNVEHEVANLNNTKRKAVANPKKVGDRFNMIFANVFYFVSLFCRKREQVGLEREECLDRRRSNRSQA